MIALALFAELVLPAHFLAEKPEWRALVPKAALQSWGVSWSDGDARCYRVVSKNSDDDNKAAAGIRARLEAQGFSKIFPIVGDAVGLEAKDERGRAAGSVALDRLTTLACPESDAGAEDVVRRGPPAAGKLFAALKLRALEATLRQDRGDKPRLEVRFDWPHYQRERVEKVLVEAGFKRKNDVWRRADFVVTVDEEKDLLILTTA